MLQKAKTYLLTILAGLALLGLWLASFYKRKSESLETELAVTDKKHEIDKLSTEIKKEEDSYEEDLKKYRRHRDGDDSSNN